MDHLERQSCEAKTLITHSKSRDDRSNKKRDFHNGLKCFYTNIDSLSNKKAELERRIFDLKPDIIGLTETVPKTTLYGFSENEMSLPGYVMYTNMNGRGTALYVKETIPSMHFDINVCHHQFPAVWCRVPLQGTDHLVIGVIYRSPDAKIEQSGSINDMIDEIVKRRHSHLLIMGDFNYPEIDWQCLASINDESCSPANKFKRCVWNHFLCQHVHQPTHFRGLQKANILDLVLRNEEEMIR